MSQRVNFITLGNYYYISGRYSFINNFTPVSANLLHHAVEMYLKGRLTDYLTDDELKACRHNLKKLWKYYCTIENDISLSKYDFMVHELNKWEDLRYPAAYSSVAATSVGAIPRIVQGKGTMPHLKQYALGLEQIDEFVLEYYKIEFINAEFYFGNENVEVLNWLRRDNKHSIY